MSGTCHCGHSRDAHQFQGHSSNWPCAALRPRECGCNWFAPTDGHDPYLVAYLQLTGKITDGVGRVDPFVFPALWEPGTLARYRELARTTPLPRMVTA